jgi:hypothetical protein
MKNILTSLTGTVVLLVACKPAVTPPVEPADLPPVATSLTDGGACLAEGQGWSAFGLQSPVGNGTHLQCCPGLEAAGNYESSLAKQKTCLPNKGGAVSCIRFGDGRCGPGENFCNCPADCH